MKKLWPLLVIIPLLLSFVCAVPLMAEEEEECWQVKLGEETYLITKVPEVQMGLRYLPEVIDLEAVSGNMETAIRANPVSLPEYIGSQIDFWFEVLKRFGKTAHPNVVFKDEAYPGLEITIYEQPKWCFTWGKVFQIEDGELVDQPSFVAIETKDIPLLSEVAEIFQKLRLQAVYVDKRFWFGLAYELLEE